MPALSTRKDEIRAALKGKGFLAIHDVAIATGISPNYASVLLQRMWHSDELYRIQKKGSRSGPQTYYKLKEKEVV